MLIRRYIVLVALLFQCLLVCAAAPALAAETHIAAELVAEAPIAPGQSGQIAIHMRPAPGWHGYWLNPGDAGFAMSLKWGLPGGVAVGKPSYPVPETLLISGLMNHVYEGDYAILVPVTLPGSARAGTRLPITLAADWLACTDKICVPERAVLRTELIVTALGSASPADPRFEQWRGRLPAPLGAPVRFALAGNRVKLAFPLPDTVALDAPHVFIGEDKVVNYAAPQHFRRGKDVLVVDLPRAAFAPVSPGQITGILRLGHGTDAIGLAFSAAPGAIDAAGLAPDVTGSTGEALALPLLLLAALAGGLLLNVMPCVFPILSLKALSLAKAGANEADARRDGLAYAAGVILACAALGALLLALRAGGSEIGWAFQLQEPLVVTALLMLAMAITANLLGLYEFSVPGFASTAKTQNAFLTGLLAAVVATPCTGPFMAGAMGAALLLPPVQALALFVALGVGIALPFLGIAYIPALRRLLPRPGPWLAKFRCWMALPMALTALALLWLASRLAGWPFALIALTFALAAIGALAVTGRRQRHGRMAWKPALAALFIAGSGLMFLPAAIRSPTAAASGLLPAQPFSEAALAAARARGKPVFVWMTADWCLTCKVNEQVAIESEDVRGSFARAGVIVLRGDWTRRSPEITRFLTRQGAAGVPLYLWYPPGAATPRQLPQVLSPASLTALVSPN